jgi:hypothetical protein
MVKEKTTKEKIEDLKTLHKPTFEKLGITNPSFIPRICYIPMGEKEQVVSFFEQDFVRGKDIYTHFVSKGYESEDPQNRLWKWTWNPYYETEYKKSDPHPDTGNVRYIIPVDELELIDSSYIERNTVVSDSIFDIVDEIPNPDQDLPIDQMSIRDLAAILLKKPVSKKQWLNDIIKS